MVDEFADDLRAVGNGVGCCTAFLVDIFADSPWTICIHVTTGTAEATSRSTFILAIGASVYILVAVAAFHKRVRILAVFPGVPYLLAFPTNNRILDGRIGAFPFSISWLFIIKTDFSL